MGISGVEIYKAFDAEAIEKIPLALNEITGGSFA
jgi:hypothetical protein